MDIKHVSIIGLSLALCLCACDGGSKKTSSDAGTNQRDGGKGGKDAGAVDDAALGDAGTDASVPLAGKSTVVGQVVDPDGRKLGGIEVQVGGRAVKTDNRGIFEAKDLPKGKAQVLVADQKHSAAQATVELGEEDSAQVSLTVIELKSAKLTDAEVGGKISDGELSVTLGPKAFKTREGAEVKGEVEARYALVREPKTFPGAPGGMRVATAEEKGELESYGIVDMRFYKEDKPIELATEAELEIPLGPNNFAQDQQVDAWSFDEKMGTWKRDGKAQIDKSSGNGKAKIKAKHFTWWGINDLITVQSCVTGKLLTATGAPVPNMAVNIVGTSSLTSANAVTLADGTFCAPVKAGSSNTLSAFGITGGSYFEWTSPNVVAGGSEAMCGGTACTDVGTVMAESLFDACQGSSTNNENHVLLLSSSNVDLDTTVKTLLERYGNTVTVGPEFSRFDGNVTLDPYDVVYLQNNVNWGTGDMPLPGQRQLINWVNCGGGLVTVEWTVWNSGNGKFKLLDAVYPMSPTTPYGSSTTSTYVQVTPDPTINNGLPAMFTFMTDSYSGTEIDLVAKPGATVFYDSQPRLEGVVGWDFNMGRVVSISTCAGPNELNDPNYGRMVANVIDWLQRDPANEPSPTP